MEDLYFPRAVQPTAVNPPQRKSILLDLLSRDVAVFLGPSLCLSLSLCLWLASFISRNLPLEESS